MSKKDPFVEAYADWRRKDKISDAFCELDIKSGKISNSFESEQAFEDLTESVDKAIGTMPTTKRGMLKFIKLLRDEFVFEDHYRLQIGVETLLRALRGPQGMKEIPIRYVGSGDGVWHCSS